MEAGKLGGATNNLSAGNALCGKAPASSFGSEKSATRDNCCRNAQMFGRVEFYILLKCHRCLSFCPWIPFRRLPQRQKAADGSIKTSTNPFFHRSYLEETCSFFLCDFQLGFLALLRKDIQIIDNGPALSSTQTRVQKEDPILTES